VLRKPKAYTYGWAFIVLAFVCSTSLIAAPPVYLTDSFTGTTAPNWVFVTGLGDGPSLTASTGVDDPGDGWLRLTNDATNQSSFVYYDQPISSALGLRVTFDFVIWSETSSVADGFAFVIFDAAATPAAGGYGGSLGYAQRDGIEGLAGGVVGIGFDEFGNYSNPTEGREGGPGRVADAIAIRGSQGETRNDGYEYITGTGSLDDFATGSAQSRDDAVIHTVRITLTPDKVLTIEWKPETSTEWETLIGPFACELECPEWIKIGYTGGTGGATAFHEIRNLEIAAAIPEPGSLALLLCGVALLVMRERRAHKNRISHVQA